MPGAVFLESFQRSICQGRDYLNAAVETYQPGPYNAPDENLAQHGKKLEPAWHLSKVGSSNVLELILARQM